MALTVADYVDLYWPNLETYLDSLNANVFDELVTDSITVLSKYNTDHLTTVENVMVKALIVCSKASSMAGVPGFKEDKFLTQFKTGSVTKVKPEDVYDFFTSEIKQYIPNYNEIAEIDTDWFPTETYRKNTAYLAPKLDTRDRKLLGDVLLTETRDDEWDGER